VNCICYRHKVLPSSNLPSRQQGTVIVVALFLVALVATMSYTMMFRLGRDIERTRLILNNIQAELYAQGAVAWAKDTLKLNWETQKSNQLIDKMPVVAPVNIVNGYEITSTITNIQVGFNINNLINENVPQEFLRMLQILFPNLENETLSQLVNAIVDWVSPPREENEYARYYLNLSLPYRAAHRPVVSISELLLVKGMKENVLAKLAPYLMALPVNIQTNIQFAPPLVLMTLSPQITLSSAQSLADWFAHNKNATMDTIKNLDIFKNNQITSDKMLLVSQFFLLETKVRIEDQPFMLYTLLERVTSGNQAVINIVWQSQNLIN